MILGHTYIVKKQGDTYLSKVVCLDEDSCHLESISLYPYIEYSSKYYVLSEISIIKEMPNKVYNQAVEVLEKSLKSITELTPSPIEWKEIEVGDCYILENEDTGLSTFIKILGTKPDGYDIDFLEFSENYMNSFRINQYYFYNSFADYRRISPLGFDKIKKIIDLCTSTIRNMVGGRND